MQPQLQIDVTSQATALVEDMRMKGYGVVPTFIGGDALSQLRSFVGKAVEDRDGAYAGFSQDELAGSGLDDLGKSPQFASLVAEVVRRGIPRRYEPTPFYQVLRCLTGKSVEQHSYLFHFDSYILTVLLPIEIAASGQAGDLIMLPNVRPIRRSYLTNLVDKLLLDNPLTQRALRAVSKAWPRAFVRVKMVPGNAYFFWGYRSIHTNEPCGRDVVRATALFHYTNPHTKSRLYQRRHVGLRGISRPA